MLDSARRRLAGSTVAVVEVVEVVVAATERRVGAVFANAVRGREEMSNATGAVGGNVCTGRKGV